MESQLVQLRKGVLEYCVLAQLEDGPRYGLELAKRLSSRGTILPNDGSLYPLLSRLRKREWVTTSLADSPTGAPRRYYEVTTAGSEALGSFRVAWKEFVDDVTLTLMEE
jgi:PadR family transcriptional regulator PadR